MVDYQAYDSAVLLLKITALLFIPLTLYQHYDTSTISCHP